MSLEVRSMENHEATTEYLWYIQVKMTSLQLAARVSRKGNRDFALKIRQWVDCMPAYDGERQRGVMEKRKIVEVKFTVKELAEKMGIDGDGKRTLVECGLEAGRSPNQEEEGVKEETETHYFVTTEDRPKVTPKEKIHVETRRTHLRTKGDILCALGLPPPYRWGDWSISDGGLADLSATHTLNAVDPRK